MAARCFQETTKKESACRQIEAAITFWKSQDFDCCITLAGAAEEQCRYDGDGSLFHHIKKAANRKGIDETEFVTDLNETRNWLKHETPSLSISRQIEEHEAIIMLIRAVGNYHALHGDSSEIIDGFVEWCQAEWIPTLAQKQDR